MAERVKLNGKVKWTNRLFEAETYTGPDGRTETSWSVLFYPDDKALDTIYSLQSQGVKNTIRRDEEGFSIRYKRPTERKMKGEVVTFQPPVVSGPDGSPWDKNVSIGNGSAAVIDLTVYSHHIPGSTTGKKAKACRLEGVQILVNNIDNGGGIDKPTTNQED